MSLITDALKASQREKDRRGTGGHPPAPLIVPLRSTPKQEFSWGNSLKIGGSLVVIVGALWTLYVRMGGTIARPARTAAAGVAVTPPPAASPDTTARVTSYASVPTAEARPQAPIVAPTDAGRRVAASPRVTRRAPPPAVKRDSAPALLQSVPAAGGAVAATPPAGGDGRLRISVEQPRGYEAARLFAVGVAAHRAGDLDAARIAYERVLLLSPNDVDALNNLGVLLGTQREYDRAEQVLRRVVRLAPRNAGAWNNLGTVLAQGTRSSDAIAAFQQALEIDPANTAARVSLAQQHLAIGSPGRARELLEEAIAANPSLAEAQYTLGQACELQKDWPGAIRAYNAFIRLAPARFSADVDRVRRRVEILSARVK